MFLELPQGLAEPPVVAFVGLKPLRRIFYGFCRGNDDPVLDEAVVRPVCGDRDTVIVRYLQGLRHPDKLADIAANFLEMASLHRLAKGYYCWYNLM